MPQKKQVMYFGGLTISSVCMKCGYLNPSFTEKYRCCCKGHCPHYLTQEQKDEARNNRVFFTSRKTLLNEFNHFEGNMNIFQPAIDITEAALQKEVADIESKLIQLRAENVAAH